MVYEVLVIPALSFFSVERYRDGECCNGSGLNKVVGLFGCPIGNQREV